MLQRINTYPQHTPVWSFAFWCAQTDKNIYKTVQRLFWNSVSSVFYL